MSYLKDMNTKEKAEYIWDYYKIYIIAGLLAVIFIIAVVHSQITRQVTIFNLTYMGVVTDDSKRIGFEKELTEVAGGEQNKKKIAVIDNLPINSISDASVGTNAQFMEKLVAEIAVGDIDLIVMDKSNFESLKNNKMLLRLDNIDGIDLKSAVYDKTEKEVYGFEVENNIKLKAGGLDTRNKVLCIVKSSKRQNRDIKVINWLLKA